MAYACPRCAADPTPSRLNHTRQCAFAEDGAFLPGKNWNCATIAVLLGHPLAQDFMGQHESLQFVPAMTAVMTEDGMPSLTDVMQDGWLILTRSERSGTVESLCHVGVFYAPALVNLQMVDECVESLRKQAQLQTGLVSIN